MATTKSQLNSTQLSGMPGGMSTRRGMSAKGRKDAIRESKEQQALLATPGKE